MLETQSLRFVAAPEKGEVSGLLELPSTATSLFIFGHGAGSHLRHPLLDAVSHALHENGVATFRYNYPYSEQGRGMDSEPVRLATVRAAVLAASDRAADLPRFAGGHSMSGRMTSLAESKAHLPGVLGIICLAFPLHPGPPDTARAAHLTQVSVPLLFISGTRDKMAESATLQGVTSQLKRARLHWVDRADHGFKVPKKREGGCVFKEIATAMGQWMARAQGAG